METKIKENKEVKGADENQALTGKVDLSRFALLGGLNVGSNAIKNQLEEARGPQEIENLKGQIVDLARAFSRDYKLRVLPSADNRWALGLKTEAETAVNELHSGARNTILDLDAKAFKPEAILYNLEDVALSPKDYVFRRLRHEASRISESDLRYLFEGFNKAEKQGGLGVPFGLLQTTCEEARVFEREFGVSAVARESAMQAMEGRYAEIRGLVGQQPLMEQFCLDLLYGVCLKRDHLPEITDQRVLDAVTRVRPAFEKYLLSRDHSSNFELLEKEIWPEAQALNAQSENDEMQRIAAEKLSQNAEKEEKFEKKFWNKMVNGMRRAIFMRRRRFTPEEGSGAVFEASESHGGKLLRKEVLSAVNQHREDAALLSEHLSDQKREVLGLRQALDLKKLGNCGDSLSSLIKALELTTEHDRLLAEAKSRIKESQQRLLSRQLPIGVRLKSDEKETNIALNQVATEAEVDQQEDKAQELLRDRDGGKNGVSSGKSAGADAREKARAEEIQRQLKNRELARQGFSSEDQNLYYNFKLLENSIVKKLQDFLEDLRPILPKKRTYGFGNDLYYTGPKLSKRAVIRKAPIKDMQVWKRRVPIDSPDPRMFVTLLIDNSPSMKGDKIVEARRTAIFWARALKELDIPFAIKYFGGETFDLKSFAQDYDDPVCRVKPGIISRLDATTQATNISDPLQKAEVEMAAQKRKLRDFFGAIFVISDGEANRGLQGEDLQRYISQLRKNYIVMNFILAGGKNDVDTAKYYFGERHVVAPDSFDKLPGESIRILRNVLKEASQRNGGVK